MYQLTTFEQRRESYTRTRRASQHEVFTEARYGRYELSPSGGSMRAACGQGDGVIAACLHLGSRWCEMK
jgi:hypothetical protein